MSDALLDLPANRSRLHALAADGVLDRAELDESLLALGYRPTSASWSAYLYWNALIIGVVLLAAGVVFFVAANWSVLPGLVRMGIVGAAMVIATLIGGYLGDTLAGRATTLLGGLLFGPLLAVYGQVYQTGADAWQLFAMWTLVLVAYGALVRFEGTWALALLGLHVSTFTWIDQELGTNFYTDTGAFVIAGLALVDGVVVAIADRFTHGREREIIAHTAAFFGLAITLPFGMLAMLEEQLSFTAVPGVAVLVAALLVIWLVYRWRRPDLGMLAAFAAVITTLITTFFGRILLDELDAELFGVAALGLLVCAQVWAFTRWLLAWRREHGHEVAR
jgi:uncharacterized membrane protein